MEFEFIKSKRGGNILVHGDGFLFRKRKVDGEKTYWKCVKNGCSATALTETDKLIRVSDKGVHDHSAQKGEIRKRKFSESVKDEVKKSPLEPAQKIYR